MEPLVLSIKETAKALGIGRSSVYALIKSGSLYAFKIGNRTLLTTESIRRLAQSGPTSRPVDSGSESEFRRIFETLRRTPNSK
ncbi:helix-turn-helix domain-containing protein [Sphingopyxis terrae subsp. ummariensis]